MVPFDLSENSWDERPGRVSIQQVMGLPWSAKSIDPVGVRINLRATVTGGLVVFAGCKEIQAGVEMEGFAELVVDLGI